MGARRGKKKPFYLFIYSKKKDSDRKRERIKFIYISQSSKFFIIFVRNIERFCERMIFLILSFCKEKHENDAWTIY